MSLDFYLTCPCCQEHIFSSNITHNLTEMADKAGLYKPLWHPLDNDLKAAKDLVPLLRKGLKLLRSDRHYFEAYNPSNGWGTYDNLLSFTESVLKACEENPTAVVSTWT